MIKPFSLFTSLCLLLVLTACSQPASRSTSDRYEMGKASRDGIGKFYMGREISHVMGYQGAGWLERSNREIEERTDLLVENLPLEADDVVADIGAGTGYFSFRMAPRVPEGKVYAVDIQQEMLDIIDERVGASGITNVETVQGNVESANLPENSVDMALFVDVYHEFSHPYEMMQTIYSALKSGGNVILIEYRLEDPSVPIKPLHKMSEAQARKELESVGFTWKETLDFLPQQHFMVFEKP